MRSSFEQEYAKKSLLLSRASIASGYTPDAGAGKPGSPPAPEGEIEGHHSALKICAA